MNSFNNTRSISIKVFPPLAPSGQFEMQYGYLPFRSGDDSRSSTAPQQWAELTLLGSEKLGRKCADPRTYKQTMQDIGLVDVVEKRLKWLLGAWPRDKRLKELGFWVREDMMEILGAAKRVFTTGLSLGCEEFDVFWERAKEDLRSSRVRAWTDIRVFLCQA